MSLLGWHYVVKPCLPIRLLKTLVLSPTDFAEENGHEPHKSHEEIDSTNSLRDLVADSVPAPPLDFR